MIVGLPGTGLGGVYYALLILLMPFRELWLRGRRGSWRFILRLWLLLGLIVAGLALKVWVVKLLLGPADLAQALPAASMSVAADSYVLPALAISPLATLAALMTGIHCLRLAKRRPSRRAGPQPNPAPV